MYNVRQMLSDFQNGLGQASEKNLEGISSFMNLLGNVYKDGAIDVKTKELISIGISCYCRCEYCIVYHSYKALEAGCRREEIEEAAFVSVGFGAGPSLGYTVTLLKECLDEFAKDFE